MRKKYYLYFSATVIAMLLWTCVRHEEPEPEPQNTRQRQALTIDDARVFFEDFKGMFAVGGQSAVGTKAGMTEIEDGLLDSLDWSQAAEAVLFGREIIEVPFAGIGWVAEPLEQYGEMTPDLEGTANTSMKLIAGTDDYDEIFYNVLYITAERRTLSEKDITADMLSLTHVDSTFSGSLKLYQLGGEFISGSVLSGGALTHTLYPEHQDVPQDGTAPPVTRSSNCRPVVWLLYRDGLKLTAGFDPVYWMEYISLEIHIECDGGGGGSYNPGYGGGPGGSTPGIGGGGGGTPPTKYTLAPLATKLLRSDSLTLDQWSKLEQSLRRVMINCVGGKLYSGLASHTKGGTLPIDYDPSRNSNFSIDGGVLRLNDLEDDASLFHEMWHAYQAYQETAQSMDGAYMNMELEAHFAHYWYASGQSYYKKGNVHYDIFEDSPYGQEIRDLKKYINYKGVFGSNAADVDLQILAAVSAMQQHLRNYRDKPFDYDRTNTENVKNLSKLAKDC